VVLVDAEGALAYARWWRARTSRAWRLPHDLEWEKAARGADGRAFPWGDVLDPAFANMVRSHAGPPGRVAVTAFPHDRSPYGVRGLGGNVRDWCANGYRREGDVADGEAVSPAPAAADEPYRMVRGGSWTSVEAWCRSAARFAAPPGERTTSVGFRLVCDLG
jgi:serine/threonine-protein kinase